MSEKEMSEKEIIEMGEKIMNTIKEKYGDDPLFEIYEEEFWHMGYFENYSDIIDNKEELYKDFELYKENI